MKSLHLKFQPISMVLMISLFLSGIPPLWAQQSTFYLETWQASQGEQPALSLDRALSTPSRIGGVYTVGSSYNESGGYYDLLVTRYNSGGAVVYRDTFNLPTPGNIIAGAITTNSSLTELFITGTVYNGSGNSYDVLTMKYDAAGQVDWYSTYNGIGNGYDGGSSLLVDNDTIYVGGAITDTTGLFGALCIKYHDGGTEVWDRTLTPNNRNLAIGTLSKGSPNELMIGVGAEFNNGTHRVGSAVLATSDGSTLSGFSENSQVDLDEITGFAADADQNLYVTGYSDAAGNGDDIVTVMLDDTLGLVWESVYNGSANSDDRPSSLDIDTLGNVYVGGYTTGSNGRDFTVIKYNNSGTQQWAALYDGASHGDDEAKAVVAGKDGLVYVTGSTDTLGQKDYHTRLLKASDGTTEWSASFNGLHSKDDEATSISLDGEGGLSVLGKNGLSNGSTEYMLVRYAKKQLTIPPGDGAASPALAFTEQRGQLTDTSGTSVEGVRFYSTGSYPPLYVQNDTLSFVTASVDTSSATPDTLHRVDITFFDSKTALMSAAGLDKLDNYRNYYLGHIPEGRARVGQYGRVAVTDLYDGINLQMFADKSGIVYYFVIQPGGDPDDLKLDFHGQDSLYLKGHNLFVGTSLGDFNLPAPQAFQIDSMGQEVSTTWTPEYSITGNRVGFSSTGAYNSENPLVIVLQETGDPIFETGEDWVEYFGGSAEDGCTDLANSSIGEKYITGYSHSMDLPKIGESILNGTIDIYVAKYKVSHEIDWTTFIGGSENEIGYGIATAGEKVGVAGITDSNNDFPQADTEMSGQSNDGVVFQLSTIDGGLINSRFLGGNSVDFLTDIEYGESDNLFVAGGSFSSDLSTSPLTNSSYLQNIKSGPSDGIVAELNIEDLQVDWLSYFGGNGDETVSDIEYDKGGDVLYIAGGTSSIQSDTQNSSTGCEANSNGDFPKCTLNGAYNEAWGGGGATQSDVFLAEFDKNRSLVWSTYLGGNGNESPPNQITRTRLDVNGATIAISGVVDNMDFPHQSVSGGFNSNLDGVFVAIFSQRDLAWSTSIGCGEFNSNFTSTDVSLSDDKVFISGSTSCSVVPESSDYCDSPEIGTFPICPGSGGLFFQDGTMPVFGGGDNDIFLASFDLGTYTMSWSTFFGGNNNENISSLNVFNGHLFIAGSTSSNQSFPLRNSVNQDEYAGGNLDAFIGMLDVSQIAVSNKIEFPEIEGTLFPNPSSGVVYIPIITSPSEISIISSSGQRVSTYQVEGVKSEFFKLNLSTLPKGIYIIQVSGSRTRSYKLVLQ